MLQNLYTSSIAYDYLYLYLFSDEQACSVTVSEGGLDKTLPDALTYDSTPTAEISLVDPNRGGTGGGNLISISGSGFG